MTSTKQQLTKPQLRQSGGSVSAERLPAALRGEEGWSDSVKETCTRSHIVSYALSALLHSALLLSFSAVLVQGMVGKREFSTLVSEATEEKIQVESLDSQLMTAGGAESQQELPQLQVVETAQPKPQNDIRPELRSDLLKEFGKSAKPGDGEGEGQGAGVQFSVPEKGHAVSKGSFTAWTVPKDPDPNQDYLIIIQIELPERVRRYPRKDLNGMVVGTDGYRQRIPLNRRGFNRVKKHRTQFIVPVPGGARKVRDTIRVESRRILKEEQTLQIEF